MAKTSSLRCFWWRAIINPLVDTTCFFCPSHGMTFRSYRGGDDVHRSVLLWPCRCCSSPFLPLHFRPDIRGTFDLERDVYAQHPDGATNVNYAPVTRRLDSIRYPPCLHFSWINRKGGLLTGNPGRGSKSGKLREQQGTSACMHFKSFVFRCVWEKKKNPDSFLFLSIMISSR